MAPTFVNTALLSILSLSTITVSNARSLHDGAVLEARSNLLKRQTLVEPSSYTGNWEFTGCYTEGTNGRALSGSSTTSNTMTDESCIAYCGGLNYFYAGTEYSDECYCGNSLGGGSAVATSTDCDMACSGNSTEACGGPNRLTLFQNGATAPAGPVQDPGPPGWSLLGCYTDSGTRTLPVGMATPGGSGSMTVALCTTACKNSGYILAGVEYAGECYCGNAIANNGPAPDGFTGCNMLCNGNSSEYCGGPNRLDMYTLGTAAATSTATSAPTVPPGNPGPPASTTVATGKGSATGLPTGWSYQGCYVDGTNGRIIANQEPDSQTNTIEACVSTCVGLGYSVAGLEYGVQCFCGNNIVNGGVLAPEDTDCSVACAGNSNEMCGGGNRMSIYSDGPVQVLQPPAAQQTGLPGSWTYSGCITENTTQRVFRYQIINANNNTATNCLTQCSNFGFGAGGMEYGEECYCGDSRDLIAAGSTVQPDASCNVPCSGDASYLCGGGNLISYYTWTGANLQTWNYPTGNGAGQYELLVGGVCIPLVTTSSVNGKYTFVEKFGTGEANSTGAYELDLAEINNPTGLWRAMHVKTDVFCSASITMPDRVGRQINVGGWSGESTFGVRLYWPDGSPGEPSVNDWQENYEEVSLQTGRWYPSAMVMSNGSILVMGGENGSNGPPVPSLEILPKPPGGFMLYCDWLDRTDPNNLYPFLVVLPSGNIFVGYYNEARILEPVNFNTISQLPNIPGSVNDFLAGRNYPLEGTAVLMPQSAPYTDPLTVMICGGSTIGAATAIDNCVSVQPEAANPVWTLERMPSQRVMPCITALPDGTYIILNGATQGVAGFGLASGPNLNAILYNPAAPVNQRMSVMANTTVARLYHSEAILMTDGRVMVSGSDPQDGVHPEEYRVEVFVPPYRMTGLTPPSYTITNQNWAYGQAVQIAVTLNQGTTATMKVALMGAVSSTHGNSMGQRTIFPAFSCAGTTCTITAPPNSHVCPPGWFQLFVVDNGNPSNAQYVRIGGDPASLGNWPDFPDFNIPGV
ncbi:hypothetical protein MMC15_001213 [Xylographa vitiligo]|nr:hypothetical protein [Xylographa vitiligo]